MGEKVLLSSKTLHLASTRKLRSRFVGLFRVLEHVGKTAYRFYLRGRFSKMFTMPSTSPSFASIPLKAHPQTHSSQSKFNIKNTSNLRPYYSIEAEASLGSIL